MRKTLVFLSLLAAPRLLCAEIGIENESIRRNLRNVEVGFDITTTQKTLKNRYKMVLTPYICNGADTVWLPQTQIYGKQRYKRERQEQALDGNRHWQLAPGSIMEGDGYAYSATVPYENWMHTASLGITRMMVGCGCDCYDGSQIVAENVRLYVPPTPFVTNNAPDVSKFTVVDANRRWAFDRDQIRIFFPVSGTTLYTDRYGNQTTLDKIIEGIHNIGNIDTLKLNRVEITGFASPEGGLELNTRLGKGRAEALRSYIQSRIPALHNEDFNLINGVENWDGLRQMVADSDMEHKEQVLRIIDSESGEARKTALQRLEGGKPYRYMLDTFYPELRNACYVAVYYDVLNDTTAGEINAANVLIREGRYAEALQDLMKYRDDSRAWNPIGVCHMMLENEEEAAVWFNRAIGAGDKTAAGNLEQIK